MSRRGWWITGFLTVTAAAVGGELWAALDHSPDTVPWTDLLGDYVPWPVTTAAVALLVTWLPTHLYLRYHRPTTSDKETDMTISLDPNEEHPREPLWSVGSIVAAATVALDAAVVWGLPLSHDRETALLAAINVAAPIAVAVWGRRRVFSPATVARLLLAQRVAGFGKRS
jgi:hypothetical protein